MKGFVVSTEEYSRPKGETTVYLASHAMYPLFKKGRENAKVFADMNEIEQFKTFWKKELRNIQLTITEI